MSDTETKARPNDLYEADFYVWTQEQFSMVETLDMEFFPEDRSNE
jgi:hypothetical protein